MWHDKTPRFGSCAKFHKLMIGFAVDWSKSAFIRVNFWTRLCTGSRFSCKYENNCKQIVTTAQTHREKVENSPTVD